MANDRVNTSPVRGVLLTTVDDEREVVETILVRDGSRTNTGMSSLCMTFLTSVVGKKVNESRYFAAPDLAGAGVLYPRIDMVPKSSNNTYPLATCGNTLETKIPVSGIGLVKGADVDTVDRPIEEISDKVAVPVKSPLEKIGLATVTIGKIDTAVDKDRVPATRNGNDTTLSAMGMGR